MNEIREPFMIRYDLARDVWYVSEWKLGTIIEAPKHLKKEAAREWVVKECDRLNRNALGI